MAWFAGQAETALFIALHLTPPTQLGRAKPVFCSAHGPELPHSVNRFEVANALALAGQDANQLVVEAVQGKWVYGFLIGLEWPWASLVK